MFQIGQEVACVIDGWPGRWRLYAKTFPLVKGRVYEVEGVVADGAILPCGTEISGNCIGIGIVNEHLKIMVEMIGLELSTYDLWPTDWFRAVQRNVESVEQAMTIFRKMTETTKTPEVIGA
ncbi:MAG: hypothetical protein GYB49_09430 [Alphaproteobacteria bacterium]|nr:hypothetical protein [Hyphomonas sp.]MBR9807430.1 hypothetical protein [Alphaproteobacteria bacterium]|tara:strand:+ start:1930 stop:2292 length:363 start_codon:yes stop_codon:yes gene_type:complete